MSRSDYGSLRPAQDGAQPPDYRTVRRHGERAASVSVRTIHPTPDARTGVARTRACVPSTIGTPWLSRVLYRGYREVLKRSGISDPRSVNWHTLRHTAATSGSVTASTYSRSEGAWATPQRHSRWTFMAIFSRDSSVRLQRRSINCWLSFMRAVPSTDAPHLLLNQS